MLNDKIKRELEVAFSKHSQPVWFRIAKYVLLGVMVYFMWDTGVLWIVLPVMIVIAIALHFWFRYKTEGWTRSYGLWKYRGEMEDVK